MGGRKFKRRSGARTIAASTTKQPCPGCRDGMAICGCVPMTGEQFTQRLGETLGELQPA